MEYSLLFDGTYTCSPNPFPLVETITNNNTSSISFAALKMRSRTFYAWGTRRQMTDCSRVVGHSASILGSIMNNDTSLTLPTLFQMTSLDMLELSDSH